MPSFGKVRYRCRPTVRWDMNRRLPISRLVRPSAARLGSTWGVRASIVLGSRVGGCVRRWRGAPGGRARTEAHAEERRSPRWPCAVRCGTPSRGAGGGARCRGRDAAARAFPGRVRGVVAERDLEVGVGVVQVREHGRAWRNAVQAREPARRSSGSMRSTIARASSRRSTIAAASARSTRPGAPTAGCTCCRVDRRRARAGRTRRPAHRRRG